MHVSDELFIEIVNIGAFLIHLGQEKVSFFDSFRPQLLKIFYSFIPWPAVHGRDMCRAGRMISGDKKTDHPSADR